MRIENVAKNYFNLIQHPKRNATTTSKKLLCALAIISTITLIVPAFFGACMLKGRIKKNPASSIEKNPVSSSVAEEVSDLPTRSFSSKPSLREHTAEERLAILKGPDHIARFYVIEEWLNDPKLTKQDIHLIQPKIVALHVLFGEGEIPQLTSKQLADLALLFNNRAEEINERFDGVINFGRMPGKRQ